VDPEAYASTSVMNGTLLMTVVGLGRLSTGTDARHVPAGVGGENALGLHNGPSRSRLSNCLLTS
jgi:hypothetical protein